ncbi:MAG: UMP kinase [Candidatus Delongbacteria bacterium]|jgi:uridylate kinase|nr:UMP kinase [Candidatus Delongbacteria bacterium]
MKYKRVLLKLSGESLMGAQNSGISPEQLDQYVRDISQLHDKNIQIAIVIGGGNIFRGLSGVSEGFDRVTGDQMGMLATTINSLAFQSALEKAGMKASLFTAVHMPAIGPVFHAKTVINELEKQKIVVLAGGTGNPYFSTDTASALRALEIKADVFLKGTRVNGVYSDDPEKYPDAIKYQSLSFEEAWNKKLHVMDLTAFTVCQENNLPVIVFNMNEKNTLVNVISDPKIGTLIHN